MTKDLKEWDEAIDRANYQVKWGLRFFFGTIIAGLLLIIFSTAHAHASFTPTFIPDPSYPSGTSITNTNTGSYYVSFFDGDGSNDEGRINTGETGHPWLYWFNNSGTGKHIIVELSNNGATGDCGYTSASTLSTCRGGDNYVAEFEVCLTSNADCAGGGGGGTTTATSTPSEVDKASLLVQFLALGLLVFVGTIWLMGRFL